MTNNSTAVSRETEESREAERLRLYTEIVILRYTLMVYREMVADFTRELAAKAEPR